MGRGFGGRDELIPSRVAWAIAEGQVNVAAPAGHVEVAFSLSKWPLAQLLAGAGAVALPAVVEVRIGPELVQPSSALSRSTRSAETKVQTTWFAEKTT